MSDDLHYEKVCEVNDIWEGEMEVFDVGENEVLIVHSPGREIRAYSLICPHAEFSLIDGELENCVLTGLKSDPGIASPCSDRDSKSSVAK